MNPFRTPLIRSGASATILGAFLVCATSAFAQNGTGLIKHDESRAFNGYTLFAPLPSASAYLIDMKGRVAHTWKGADTAGNSVYLLEDGRLLKTYKPADASGFGHGGAGGGLRLLDWNGDVLWEFIYADRNVRSHHDAQMLPNGNVLLIAWELKTRAEAVAAGRDPNLLQGDELWPDHLVEIKPEGRNGGKIVWKWRVWDHLIQDFDPSKANYGVIADHPELIDINNTARGQADWNHLNSLHYNASLDQILLSSHNQNEIWIIDHGTTTAEAKGHTGGKRGKGGDLIYRWGNPQVYQAGWPDEQQLFAQHDAQWIPEGHPGADNILVFNNGSRRRRAFSTVDEIVPPIRKDGGYELTNVAPYGPDKPKWTYGQQGWYAQNISGSQRLPNGNTLICSGPQGRFIEVTPAKDVVWEFTVPQMAGGPGMGPPPGGGQGRFPGGPRGRGGPGGGPGGEGTAVFRATRYAPDYPGFKGRTLTPGETLEKVLSQERSSRRR